MNKILSHFFGNNLIPTRNASSSTESRQRLKADFQPRQNISLRSFFSCLPVFLVLIAVQTGCGSQTTPNVSDSEGGLHAFEIPHARRQLILREAIVREKLDTALLPAMRNHDVDMWIVCDRENNPDPLHEELGGGYSGAAAVYMFADSGGGHPEKIYFAPSEQPLDSPIARIYDIKICYGGDFGELKRLLRREVTERNPRRIAVNISDALASADGLTVSMRRFLRETLGSPFAERMISSERIVHEFRSRRVSKETELYRHLQEWTNAWETSALEHVVPGKTTAMDLWCGLLDKASEAGLSLITDHGRFPVIVWYCDQEGMPGLSAFNSSRALLERGMPWTSTRDFAIEPGDLITLDGGLRFLGFSSDMKRTAYVLKPEETEPPDVLRKAWLETLEVAELYAGKLVPGTVGRSVWRDLAEELQSRGFAVAGMETDSIDPKQASASFYGHSVGSVAHDVGTRVAPGGPSDLKSDLPLIDGEWVSVEFHLETPDPNETGKRWFTRFEQTGQVGPRGLKWLIPIQEAPLLIHSDPLP